MIKIEVEPHTLREIIAQRCAGLNCSIITHSLISDDDIIRELRKTLEYAEKLKTQKSSKGKKG